MKVLYTLSTVLLGLGVVAFSGCKKDTAAPVSPETASQPLNPAAPGSPPANVTQSADDEAVVAAMAANPRVKTQTENGSVVSLDLLNLTPEESDDLVEEFGWAAGLPMLKTLRAAGNGITDQAVAKLAAHPALENVLFEDRSAVTDVGIETVAALPKLLEVSLKRADISDEAFKFLGKSKTLRRIRAPNTKTSDKGINYLVDANQLELLDFVECSLISDACAPTLEKLTKLRFLRIYGSSITDAMTPRLAGLKNLSSLTLQYARITDDGLKNLEGLSNLKELGLYGTRVADGAWPTLAKLTKLQRIRLRETAVRGEENFEGLANLKDLIELDVSECPVQDPLLDVLGKLTKLENLDFWNTEISDAGLAKLAGLKDLKELNLENVYNITDAAMDTIAGFEKLATLNISATQITDAALPKLYGLKNLKKLNISHNPSVSSEAFKALKEKMPWVSSVEF
jgi:Leucine-rich repeat (LRR) protein